MPDFLIGRSPALKRIKSSIKKLSVESHPLVIIGEPGVGKSLLASRIHAHSALKSQSIESINFRTLDDRDQRISLLGGGPPELTTTRRSYLEFPTTVILKHIDYAPHYLQEQLTNALQTRKIVRLGTNETFTIRCRFIFIFATTPKVLFRENLLVPKLFRLLSKYPSRYIPPLNRRKEDIPMLAQYFLTKYHIKRHSMYDQNFIDLIQNHHWDENILDLKAFIASLQKPCLDIAIQQKGFIELAKMKMMIEEGKEFSVKYSLSVIEKQVVQEAMAKYDSSQSETAKAIGFSDRGIRHILKQNK